MNAAVILSALAEAWQEVRIQKTRVILSLVGVAAAVAAMSTVIALSEIMTQGFQEEMEAASGRDKTITLHITKKSEEENTLDAMDTEGEAEQSSSSKTQGTASDLTNAPLGEETLRNYETVGWNANDVKPSVFTRATEVLVSRFSLSHYSRVLSSSTEIPEVTKAATDGYYKGRPVVPEGGMADMMQYMGDDDMASYASYITTKAVDPSYSTIYRLRVDHGRWLSSGDVNQQVTPVVINSIMWSYLAKTPLDEGIVLTVGDNKVRVVGVVQAKSYYEEPMVYFPYDSWELAHSKVSDEYDYSDNALLVWVDPAQEDEARKNLSQTLSSLLGDSYKVSAESGMDGAMYMDSADSTNTIVLIIGAIVILLGILGLLNVAIVTVRQRVREIGIRRAVGASAKRVFFAVFLESVVATFIAGLIGVVIAIFAVRNIPLEYLGIYLQDTPGFPMSTAITALLIATGIGALAGIIPAYTAVKVKPIDAIRY